MQIFVPTTEAYRTSGSFDLFPQHYILPELSPIQHTITIDDELINMIEKVPTESKKKLISSIKKVIRTVKHNPTLSNYTVSSPPPTEGGLVETEGGVGSKSFTHTPAVDTPTNNPTAPRVLLVKNRTHLKTTRNNTPGSLPDIITEAVPE